MEPCEIQKKALPLKRDEALFERVFKAHFKALHAYAFTFVKDNAVAEDMVQNIFLRLWNKADEISITQSFTAYLYRCVYNECLNYLRHEKVKAAHETYLKHNTRPSGEPTPEEVTYQELKHQLSEALQTLPEGCRTIFQLSRFESLKYREIADKLGLSVKTVENQMGKALRILRVRLIDFLPLMLLLASSFIL